MGADANRARHDFTELVRTQRLAVEGRALRLCGNADEARDLTQDTFERAWRHFDSFAPASPPRAWLMTVLTNLFLDRIKRRRVAGEVPLALHDVATEEPPEPPPDPERTLAALATLPPELREIVELHDLGSLRYREIAARLSIPIGTVGTRLVRARAILKARLAPTEET
jgi:RNA polymerase sigma-70 factor (ECF subfamily)